MHNINFLDETNFHVGGHSILRLINKIHYWLFIWNIDLVIVAKILFKKNNKWVNKDNIQPDEKNKE